MSSLSNCGNVFKWCFVDMQGYIWLTKDITKNTITVRNVGNPRNTQLPLLQHLL